jgi:hypothetical protein
MFSKDLKGTGSGLPWLLFEVHHSKTYCLIAQIRQGRIAKGPDILGSPVEAVSGKDSRCNSKPIQPHIGYLGAFLQLECTPTS